MKIEGRTFIISGGVSGLGLATARALHSLGGYVSLKALDTPGIEHGAFRLQSGRATTALCARHMKCSRHTIFDRFIAPHACNTHTIPVLQILAFDLDCLVFKSRNGGRSSVTTILRLSGRRSWLLCP